MANLWHHAYSDLSTIMPPVSFLLGSQAALGSFSVQCSVRHFQLRVCFIDAVESFWLAGYWFFWLCCYNEWKGGSQRWKPEAAEIFFYVQITFQVLRDCIFQLFGRYKEGVFVLNLHWCYLQKKQSHNSPNIINQSIMLKKHCFTFPFLPEDMVDLRLGIQKSQCLPLCH